MNAFDRFVFLAAEAKIEEIRANVARFYDRLHDCSVQPYLTESHANRECDYAQLSRAFADSVGKEFQQWADVGVSACQRLCIEAEEHCAVAVPKHAADWGEWAETLDAFSALLDCTSLSIKDCASSHICDVSSRDPSEIERGVDPVSALSSCKLSSWLSTAEFDELANRWMEDGTHGTAGMRILLSDSRCAHPAALHEWLLCAIKTVRSDVAMELLQNPQTDAMFEFPQNDVFFLSVSRGLTNIAAFLLRNPRLNPSESGNRALRMALMLGNRHIVDLLLRDSRLQHQPSDWRSWMHIPVENRNKSLIARLLEDPRLVVESEAWTEALKAAMDRNRIDIASLLLADARSDELAGRRGVLRAELPLRALYHRNLDAFRQFLSDSRAFLCDQKTCMKLLNSAIHSGFLDAVALMLADARFQPFTDAQHLLTLACRNDRLPVARMILESADQRKVQLLCDTALHCLVHTHIPAAQFHNLLCDCVIGPLAFRSRRVPLSIVQSHRCDLLQRFMEHPSFHPDVHGSLMLMICVNANLINPSLQCLPRETMDILLRDSRVNPACRDNGPLIDAAQNGHDLLVKRLLRDPRVDPSARNHSALRLAAMHRRHATVKLLKPFAPLSIRLQHSIPWFCSPVWFDPPSASFSDINYAWDNKDLPDLFSCTPL